MAALTKMDQQPVGKFRPFCKAANNLIRSGEILTGSQGEIELGEDEDDLGRRIFDKIFDHEETLKYYRGEVPEEVSHYDPFPEKSGLRC